MKPGSPRGPGSPGFPKGAWKLGRESVKIQAHAKFVKLDLKIITLSRCHMSKKKKKLFEDFALFKLKLTSND